MTSSPKFLAIKPGARLADQVAATLESEIRSGRIPPGDLLPSEASLGQQFAVSRTVVREAISRLKSQGLVEAKQGRGVFVREPGVTPLDFPSSATASKAAVLQIVEVRRALEAEVAALAAERRTPQDIDGIKAAVLKLDEAVQQGRNGVEEDVRFHRAIAQASHNPYLINTLDFLAQFLRGATTVTRANEARRQDFSTAVRDEHAHIVAAIEAGDREAAREAAHTHMANAARRIELADPSFWCDQGEQLAQPLISAPPIVS